MSRRRRPQSNTQAALAQTVATLATQVADLTRRLSPEQAARGTPLPPHIVNPPRQQRTPAIDQMTAKGDVNMGVPSQQMMNQMLANQAPQEGAVGIYAPGAPLQVVPGIESPYGPRLQDYNYGYNIAALPRSTERTSFQELRDLSDLYYGIRLCERVWFDVLNRLEAKITLKPGVIPDGEADTDAKWQKVIQPAADFLAYPDRHHSLSDWLIMSCGDVLELGQSVIFKARNKKGEIISLDVVDAATIKPLLDQRGNLPRPPYPAFEQFIKGIPAGLYPGEGDPDGSWTQAQMHLITEMQRTNSIYARSRVEEILLTINQALRLQNLNLTRYTDGATPEGMVFIDDTTGEWDTAKVDEVERFLNGLLAGNDRLRARLKVMPPGLKDYKETRMDDPKTDFELWLLKITCAAFGVTPAELGLTDDVNRSTGDSQENVIYRRVVQPLARRYGNFLTQVIQERFDKRLILQWAGLEEREDEMQKAQMLQIGVQTGAISPSTMAKQMGWPVDKEIPPFVMFNGGPQAVVVLDDMDALRKQQLQSFQTQTQSAEASLQNTKLQGQQLQMVIDQQKQQQGGQSGEEGENEPEPNGPSGGNGGAGEGNEEAPEEGEGESEAPEQESGETGNEQENEGGESEQGGEDNEELPPDEQAQQEVDRLIAEAKKRQQGKGKQQRMQVADEDENDNADRSADYAERHDFSTDHRDDGRRTESPWRDADAVGRPDSITLATGSQPGQTGRRSDSGFQDGGPIAVSDEWRRYRDVALRAVKRGQSVPAFTSDVLPTNLHAYAAEALQRAVTADEVRQVFADVRAMEQAEQERTWAEHEIVRGANGRIIGNIYPDGHFEPVGEGHERTANAHEHAAIQAKSRLDQANTDYNAARRAFFEAADAVNKASKPKRGGGYLDEPRRGVSPEQYQQLQATRDALRDEWNNAYLPVHAAQQESDAAHLRATQSRLIADRPNGAEDRYHPDMAKLETLSTTSEVETWLRQTFPETQFHLGDMHAEYAKDVARELGETGRQYPEVMASLHGVALESTARAQANDPYFTRAMEEKDPSSIAQVMTHLHEGEWRSVLIFSDSYRDPQRQAVLDAEASHVYSDGRTWIVRGDARGTTRHEFGHVAHEYLRHNAGEYGTRAFARTRAMFRENHRSNISVYADEKEQERFAEGFSAAKYGTDAQKHDAYVEEIMLLLSPFAAGGAS